eukprot:23134-Eustigmatos_ZCMA.PRE.1
MKALALVSLVAITAGSMRMLFVGAFFLAVGEVGATLWEMGDDGLFSMTCDGSRTPRDDAAEGELLAPPHPRLLSLPPFC